jgi:hypothetical protein
MVSRRTAPSLFPNSFGLEDIPPKLDNLDAAGLWIYFELSLFVVPNTLGNMSPNRERIAGMQAQTTPTGTSIVLQ